MKELVNNMLAEIEVNISEIDLYGYDIVETFLSIVRRLQAVLNFPSEVFSLCKSLDENTLEHSERKIFI